MPRALNFRDTFWSAFNYYLKTVDVITKDLPARVIDTPVIVHTIEPPPNKHGAKAGYGARNMFHSQAVFLDCYGVRILLFRFPVHGGELLLPINADQTSLETLYLRTLLLRWNEDIRKRSEMILKCQLNGPKRTAMLEPL